MSTVHHDVSRSYLARLIEDGHVDINGVPVTKKGKKLKHGDEVGVFFAPVPELQLEPEDLGLEVLFEDDEIIFVNKPAGMVVHPAPGNWSGALVHGLLHHFGHGPLQVKLQHTRGLWCWACALRL